MSDRTTITVYTRDECHLCEDAIETIRGVVDSTDTDIDIVLIDIDTNSELRDRYGDRVPYVFVNDRPQFKYHVDENELREILSSIDE
jgi:glutaredoxin